MLPLALLGALLTACAPPPATLLVAPGVGGEWDDPAKMLGVAAFTTIQEAVESGVPHTNTGLLGKGVADIGLRDLGFHFFQIGIDVSGSYYVAGDDLTLSNNLDGLLCDSSEDCNVTNSLITSNSHSGLTSTGGGSALFAYNTLVGNGLGGGDGLAGAITLADGGSEIVSSNVLVSNGDGLNCHGCSGTWDHNNVWGNSTDHVNDAAAVPTNISADPLFVNAAEDDFGLTAGSPNIDTASTTVTVDTNADGELRPQGAASDIGIDEYAASALDLVITRSWPTPPPSPPASSSSSTTPAPATWTCWTS